MSDSECVVEFQHVSKIFRLQRKDKLANEANKNNYFYALKDLSFTVNRGQVLGILGTNGSGKSTMALLLAGISEPNEGKIMVKGEQALVAINTGLNKQLTGLENIELKGALLGLPKKRIDEITQGVIEFAEIGDFLYQPVKKYSSGMKSRLGFSINLCLDPDILIVDEALSVGDKGFAKKCIDRMTDLKEDGKTILFISHSLQQVNDFCDSALWLEGGFLREMGDIDDVCEHYSEYVDNLNAMTKKEREKETARKFEKRLIPNKEQSRLKRFFS